jgi:serine/threonine protein kinase
MAEFFHKNYTLENNDKIVRKPDAQGYKEEDAEILEEVARYVEAKLITDFGFVSIQIPEEEESGLHTSILASPEWVSKTKLLIISQNSSGSQMGIFSRSIVFDSGISKGSWLPYIEKAIGSEYGVLLLRPNTNFITQIVDGEKLVKVAIKGSESPEIHALNVWENVVPKAEHVDHIALLGFGNGAGLCKDFFLREMASVNGPEKGTKIKAFITIAASHIVDSDDDADTKALLGKIAINMECNPAPIGHLLEYKRSQLGCATLSLGLPEGVTEVRNDAIGVSSGMETVFQYLAAAEAGGSVCKRFCADFCKANGLTETTAVITQNPYATEEMPIPPPPPSPTPSPPAGFFSRMFGGGGSSGLLKANKDGNVAEASDKLTVADFDLLKIVGKGAFGKVMLVRKKASQDSGNIYAMKVLKKSVVAAKGQVEHTKSERDILFEVKHPYIVRLRYAFQSEDKLYLVTDYYNGGTLFYHLRKSKCFTEERARMYAAELLSALDHLHQQNIIYRDLKLENVLMDYQGHLALTDFGLSKQNIDSTGGATTFCGTAEYIAPELLKGQKYGPAVDWWSFGILIYEMMHGRTPFYDKNRKLMFYRIINAEPTFPPTFSPAACKCIKMLLKVNEQERLGTNGGLEIMKTDFFAPIDFDKLYRRELQPPFTPEVVNEFDTKYVPKAYLQAEAKDSFDEPEKGKKKDGNPKFEAFTYQGGSALG